MTAEEAARVFCKKHTNLKVTSMFDRGDYYVLTAVENPEEVDYNAPFYAVKKKTGEISGYSPLAEPDVFFKAMEKGDLLEKAGSEEKHNA